VTGDEDVSGLPTGLPSFFGERKTQREEREGGREEKAKPTEKPNHMISLDHLRSPLPLLHRLQILPVARQRPLVFEARVGGELRGMVEDAGRVADLLSEHVRRRLACGEVVVGFAARALVCGLGGGLQVDLARGVHGGQVGVWTFGPHFGMDEGDCAVECENCGE